ncbi:MAG: DUF885 domain-containing protein [Lachnospiraceae bacterium]
MKKWNWKISGRVLTLIILMIVMGLSVGCGAHRTGAGTGKQAEVQKAFAQYANQVFRSEVTASTLNMHYTIAHPENYGITAYPITYGGISTNSTREAAAILENWNSSLKSYNKENLTVSQQMTYDIMMDYIQMEIPASKFVLHKEILKPTTGIQAQLPVLMSEYTFYNEQDVKDYLTLLAETPNYLKQIIGFEEQKSKAGLFMSDYAAEDIICQCQNFIQEPENNYMLATFDTRIDELECLVPKQAQEYKAQNHKIIIEQVVPAYAYLAQKVEALKGTGKNTQGLCYLNQGKEYYEYLAAYATGSGRTIEKLKSQTQTQREADLMALAEIIKKNPQIITQCRNYTLAEEEPMLILQELQEKMQRDFPISANTSFAIKSVHPSLAKYTAPAFYLTPPIDDISQNSIYINTTKNYQKIQLYTTLAHEGFPGHLYQNIMERSCGLEPIRSLFGTSGYSEGWATYVEMQSYYYADIDQNLAEFFQKKQAALLSLYATADMGIHYDGWSLADTVDFFNQYQITDKSVITQIYQLIVEEPAHYLKYYIGYLEFLELKKYAMETYQDTYSNYKFHQAVLKMGNAPFPILKKYLPMYWEK